jgi:hypothetical protein
MGLLDVAKALVDHVVETPANMVNTVTGVKSPPSADTKPEPQKPSTNTNQQKSKS